VGLASNEVYDEVEARVGPAVPTVTGIPYPHKPSHLSVGPRKIGGLTSLTASGWWLVASEVCG
jgi:hypothetical protein